MRSVCEICCENRETGSALHGRRIGGLARMRRSARDGRSWLEGVLVVNEASEAAAEEHGAGFQFE